MFRTIVTIQYCESSELHCGVPQQALPCLTLRSSRKPDLELITLPVWLACRAFLHSLPLLRQNRGANSL